MRWWWWYVCMYSVTLREAKSTFTRSDYVDCLRWENWKTTQQHTKESKCNVFLTLRASWTCVCSLWGCAGGFTGSTSDPELGRVSSLPHPPSPSMSVYLFRPAAHVNCIFLPERSTSGFTTSKHAGRRLIWNFMLMLTYKVIITLSAGHLNQIINHNNLVRQ